MASGDMTLNDVEELNGHCRQRVSDAVAEAESLGTLSSGSALSPVDMFRHVYAEMPPHLIEQRQQLGY